MKICFITNTIENIGGVQRVLIALANGLALEHSVTILCDYKQDKKKIPYEVDDKIMLHSSDSAKEWRPSYQFSRVIRKLDYKFGLKNIKLQGYGAYPPVIQKRYIKYFSEEKFDIIIGVQGRYSLLLSLIENCIAGVCIGWYHNSYKAYFQTRGHYYWKQDKLYSEQMAKLKACVALTKMDCELFNQNIYQNFTYIYNPLTISNGRISRLNHNNVLFVGRIVYQQKGIDYLLSIVEEVVKAKKDFHLTIIGSGEDQERLVNDITSRKLESYISFLGEFKDVSPYYLNSDLVLNTSRWEGFGLVITEAMAYGIPVISFSTEGPSEIIDSNVDGIIIDKFDIQSYAEAIVQIMNDSSKRIEMGKAALEKAKLFKMDHVIRKWNDLFEELMK